MLFPVRAEYSVALLCLLLIPGLGVTADDPSSFFDDHPDQAPVVETRPVLQLYVSLAEKITLGQTDDGIRHIVPITGGHFSGDGLSGIVMPGGADWQQDRSDGVRTIMALYSIKTDDGYVIVVDNRGISFSENDETYRRTIPKFHAPEGKYDWLNKKLFVGTITSIPSPRAVIIRVYAVE